MSNDPRSSPPLPPLESATMAVVIPCYNEADSIESVIREFQAALPSAEIHVIDNNCTDATAERARGAGAHVACETRQGKGYALELFPERIVADYYVLVDGDGTYPAEYARQMLEILPAGQADMVVGDRQKTYHQTRVRRFHGVGNQLIRTLINLIFHSSIKDPLSGFRAFTRRAVLTIPFMTRGFDVETEITIQALLRRLVIREIDIPYRERLVSNPSKLNTFRDGFLILFRIFLMMLTYKPLTVFFALGVFIMLCGGLMAIPTFVYHDISAKSFFVYSLSSGCLVVIGYVTILCGLLLHLINIRTTESQKFITRMYSVIKLTEKR